MSAGNDHTPAPGLPPRASRWMRAEGIAAVSVGLLVLAGWMFEIDFLRSVIPGLVTMKAHTALLLVVLGSALLLSADGDRTGIRSGSARALAAFAIVAALVTVSQTWSGADYGIDELLFRDPTATGAPPGRMAQPTALALILIGVTILMLHAGRALRLALSVLAAGLGCFAWLNVIGYFYNVTALTRPSASVPMALHTSAMMALLLGLCAVLLARDGWAAILLDQSAPADLARRLVPIALLLPLALGWIRLWGEHRRWFGPQMGVAVFALLNVVILMFLVIAFAQRLGGQVQAMQKIERELERTSARLGAVLDSVGHGVFVLTGDRRLELFSRMSATMLGREESGTLGTDVTSLHPAEDAGEAGRWYDAVIGSGTEAAREWRWLRADGTTLEVEVKLSPVRDNGGGVSGFVGVATDITLRKEAARVIEEARRAAEEANVHKTRFLANMSHELRTPLNGIIGFSYLLRKTGAATLTPDQLRQVSVIESSGRHLLQVINDVLDLAKVETGKMTPNLERVELAALVEECRLLLSAVAQEKDVSIDADVPRDAPAVLADRKMVKQMLVNLLGNALKFTPAGGRVRVTVARLGTERVVLRVTDTGIGIDPTDQLRIFDAFDQVDSAYTRDQEGTGLGLTLTRRLVELHGGTIRVESEGEGKGSAFIIELPAAPSEVFDEAAFAGASRGPLVLVADDDPATREILGRALTGGGYSVMFAADTADLLRKAREHSPTAITLDVLMPPRNGWEALSQLKSNLLTRHIPVVIVSVIEDRVLAFSLGAADHLVKPVDDDQLVHTVARAVADQARIPRRILVVDDDPSVRELLSADLTEAGYEVTTAPDAEVALDAVERIGPDLAIIDVAMPGMSGLQLVRRLRESGGERASLPVIVYSARGLDDGHEWVEAMVDAVVPESSPAALLREMERITGGPVGKTRDPDH